MQLRYFFSSAKGFCGVERELLAQITYTPVFLLWLSVIGLSTQSSFWRLRKFIGLISTHWDENEECFESMKYQQLQKLASPGCYTDLHVFYSNTQTSLEIWGIKSPLPTMARFSSNKRFHCWNQHSVSSLGKGQNKLLAKEWITLKYFFLVLKNRCFVETSFPFLDFWLEESISLLVHPSRQINGQKSSLKIIFLLRLCPPWNHCICGHWRGTVHL